MNYNDVDVKCPYYIYSGLRFICCEGTVSKWSQNEFISTKKHLEHFEKYCCGKYGECLQAKALDEKYK